jgi:hypothetical protein
LICGVTLGAETYAKSKLALETTLSSRFPTIPKFHATEIVNPPNRSGLKRVFVRNLLDELRPLGGTTAIVLDPDSPIVSPRMQAFPGADWLYSGGLVEAHSHEVPGLQLADFAAYAIMRFRRTRDDLLAGTGSRFDEITAATLAQLEGRVTHLLG